MEIIIGHILGKPYDADVKRLAAYDALIPQLQGKVRKVVEAKPVKEKYLTGKTFKASDINALKVKIEGKGKVKDKV